MARLPLVRLAPSATLTDVSPLMRPYEIPKLNGKLPLRPGRVPVLVSTVRVALAAMSIAPEASSFAVEPIETDALALAIATVMLGINAANSLQSVGSRPNAPRLPLRALELLASPNVVMMLAQVSSSVQPLAVFNLLKSAVRAAELNRLPSNV